MKSQPFNVFHDGIYILHIFLLGVGIVEAEVTDAAVILGNAEIDANSLGMTDVQVAVRFRRKTGLYAPVVLSLLQIVFDNLFNKIETLLVLLHDGIFCF